MQFDLLPAGAAALEGPLPLLSLHERLELLEIHEFDRSATLRGLNVAGAVAGETLVQVVRAAVVVAAVGTA
jgi:hypothetical protein